MADQTASARFRVEVESELDQSQAWLSTKAALLAVMDAWAAAGSGQPPYEPGLKPHHRRRFILVDCVDESRVLEGPWHYDASEFERIGSRARQDLETLTDAALLAAVADGVFEL